MDKYDNFCTFSLKEIQTVFRNNIEFDSIDLYFPTKIDIDDLQIHHHLLRNTILKYFNTRSQPNAYAIGMAFFIYKTNPEFFFECKNWLDFNCIDANLSKYEDEMFENEERNEDDEIYCLCGHWIHYIFLVEYKGYYAMLGCDCIEKSKIKSIKEKYHKLTHYTCIECNNEYKQKLSSKPKTICGHCDKKSIKKEIIYYTCYGCNKYYKNKYFDQHFCGRCNKISEDDKNLIYDKISRKYCPVIRKETIIVPKVVPIVDTGLVKRSSKYHRDDIIWCFGRNRFVEARNCICTENV